MTSVAQASRFRVCGWSARDAYAPEALESPGERGGAGGVGVGRGEGSGPGRKGRRAEGCRSPLRARAALVPRPAPRPAARLQSRRRRPGHHQPTRPRPARDQPTPGAPTRRPSPDPSPSPRPARTRRDPRSGEDQTPPPPPLPRRRPPRLPPPPPGGLDPPAAAAPLLSPGTWAPRAAGSETRQPCLGFYSRIRPRAAAPAPPLLRGDDGPERRRLGGSRAGLPDRLGRHSPAAQPSPGAPWYSRFHAEFFDLVDEDLPGTALLSRDSHLCDELHEQTDMWLTSVSRDAALFMHRLKELTPFTRGRPGLDAETLGARGRARRGAGG